MTDKSKKPSASLIKRRLKELRTTIDNDPDPVVRRTAYAMECAVRWVTEKTAGWDTFSETAKFSAVLIWEDIAREIIKPKTL